MEVKTLTYQIKKGWSVKNFPDLDSEQTLIIVFAAPEFIHVLEPIKELAERYPKSKMIGCSTAGEIFDTQIHDKSISIAIIRFEKTKIKIVSSQLHEGAEDSFNVGQDIAQQLKADDLKGIFVLSDGIYINGSQLVKGLNSSENKNIVITGGLAADGRDFKKTWTILNGKIYTNKVVAVGFYGNHIQIGHGSGAGWDIFGPERYITRSKGNILYELDGRPALDLYKEYLGDRAKDLPATGLLFPLAIRKNTDDQNQLVRTILAIDEDEQSLIFAGDVPVGYLAQLMRANFDRLISTASEVGELATKKIMNLKDNESNPIVAISISCAGRRLLLGERTEEETESLKEMLPRKTQQIGFYSYGEISPHEIGKCGLHNQTMTLTLLYEK